MLRDEAATEEALDRSLPAARVVHLATHGFFHPDGVRSLLDDAREEAAGAAAGMLEDRLRRLTGRLPGLLSGLVCAGANLPLEDGREDGQLTAEEVGWLDLSRCDLVVLSACQTGLGRARGGEGLISLRRAFRQAGARTVISSLWKVRDDATRDLMVGFYERLWQQQASPLAALRGAQLALLQRNRERYNEPLPETWGAFVLSGEWR